MRLGTVLRRWRAIEERSLRDVAAEMGIAHNALHRFESGEGIDGENLVKILKWLLSREKGLVV